MDFNVDFFDAEVRCDFPVPSFMKYAWAAQIQFLEEIRAVCKKHNITYYAGWGTLLGAVRHNGFIPWDDDIDICMKRADYEKFLKVYKQEKPDSVVINNIYTHDTYRNTITNIMNSSEVDFSEEYLKRYSGFPCSMGLDIYVLDYLPDDPKEEQQLKDALDFLVSLIAQYDELSEEDKKIQLSLVRQSLGVTISNKQSVKKQLGILLEKICSMYTAKDGMRLTNMMMWQYNTKYNFSAKEYEETTEFPFEYTYMSVPKGYDTVLRHDFGENYMTPINYDGGHNYPYFMGQYLFSVEKAGLAKYKPTFFPGPRDGKERERENTRRWNEYIAVAQKAEASISIALKNGQSEVAEELTASVMELSKRLEMEVAAEENRVEKVLFVVCQNKNWVKMKKYYDAELSKDKCEVKVLVASYLRKHPFENNTDAYNEKDLFKDKYGIDSISMSEYINEHFDRIYFQTPWDEFEINIETDENVFSEKLRERCDQLIYIPYMEIHDYDERSQKTAMMMQFVCRLPGLLNADRITVPNSVIKDLYLRHMMAFTGVNTKEVWNEKIIVSE